MTISHYLQFFFFPWNIAIYTLLDVLLTHISQLFYLKIPIIKNFSAGILNVLILFVLVWPTIDIQIVDLQRRSLGWYDSWPQHIYILLSRYCCPSFMEVYMFAILWISLGTSHHLIQGLDAAPSVWSSSEILKYQTHILPFLFIQVSSVYTKPILFFQVQFLAFCCNNLLDKIQSHPSLPGFSSTVWRQLSLFIDTKSLFSIQEIQILLLDCHTSCCNHWQGKFFELGCGECEASYTDKASPIKNQGLRDHQEPRPDFRYIVGSLRLRPWRRLFNGVNPADSKGEAREGRRWSFKQSLERWRHQYPKYIPSHPMRHMRCLH